MTLSERAALLLGDDLAAVEGEGDAVRARRRLERWRGQWPFATDPYLARRLESDGIDELQFLELLGMQPEQLRQAQGGQPPWLVHVLQAYARPASAYADYAPGEEMFGFLDLIQPLIDEACNRLRRGIDEMVQRWPVLPFDLGNIEDILLMNLPEPLLMRLSRTMTLELNVARLQGQLQGETPAERFRSFVAGLRQPGRSLEILAEYPVLVRQLMLVLTRWTDVSLEFLRRLCADWEFIQSAFSPEEYPGPLAELRGGAGDTHRGGRSVMVAEFDSGFRVVYKPKSLAIDQHFQDLLADLNMWGCTPSLRLTTTLDRGEYGWVEFVARAECTTPDEIERFYLRHGAYLALLYGLNSTDFHLENIIAAGEHPMLIDLETLFNSLADNFDVSLADLAAQKAMAESVMQIGMLPVRIWSGGEYDGIDISGLGGTPGQLSPDRVPEATDLGTDAMHFVRRRFEIAGDANRPSLAGQETRAVDHVESIVAGFVDMYRLLVQHKRELLADDGPLQRFADDEIRILMRPTRTYAQLLFESFHPDLLRDALERDLVLDRLWIVVPGRPNLAEVVAAERDDILQGDIPLFTSRPSTRDMYSATGRVLSGVLSGTGMAIVRRRLLQLSEHDMRRQVWLIRASLGTLAPGIDRPPTTTHRLHDGASRPLRERLHAGVRDIAEHLGATAVYGEEDAAWIGLEPMGEQYWSITPLGIDLYNGNPGIALFLAYAGQALHEERYTVMARRAYRTMWQQAELLRPVLPEIGAFEGWGGVLYTLTHLGMLWDDATIKAQAAQIAEVLAHLIERNDTSDVVRGSAGAIATLLAYHACMPSAAGLAAAVACGEQLLATAQPMATGVGWPISRLGPEPLAGFSHGAAGIAWALLELAAISGDDRYRAVARQAIAYERSLYMPASKNWPDLRRAEPAVNGNGNGNAAPALLTLEPTTAWCHGATGIGLARLHSLRHLDDPQLVGEIETALATTLADGFGHTHSLCHGDMGSLDFLLEASRVLGTPDLREQANRLAAQVLDSIEHGGWQCGGPPGVEAPGLMLGLAGVGYGMLRVADPERTPSVLCLTPPGC